MAKFYGAIGFAETMEILPGTWKEQITERNYYGDLVRNTRRVQSSDQVNDGINIANEISIVSDPYANENFFQITVIDDDPDSQIVVDISKFPSIRFNRHFVSDNLNHDVFILYY